MGRCEARCHLCPQTTSFPPRSRCLCMGSSENVAAPILSVFVDFFSLGLLAPLIPLLVEEWGEGEHWVGWLLSGQYLAVVIGQITVGWLSDAIADRRSVTLLVTGGQCLCFVASALVPSLSALLAV